MAELEISNRLLPALRYFIWVALPFIFFWVAVETVFERQPRPRPFRTIQDRPKDLRVASC
jgi:hypothetical protein